MHKQQVAHPHWGQLVKLLLQYRTVMHLLPVSMVVTDHNELKQGQMLAFV